MQDADKLLALKAMLEPEEGDETTDDFTLLSYLDMAKGTILNRMYPYPEVDYDQMTVPARYEHKQIRIAAYLLNKRGAEGETQHIENGTHRNYGSADVPEDMLWDVIPVIGIPR